MKFISLVIPTIGRVKQIDELLNSIVNQNYNNLEVIIVNQNKNANFSTILKKYEKKLKIFYYLVDFKGAAKARNFGAQKTNGEIINFPDDDSKFAEDVLKYVNEFFYNENADALFGKVEDPQTKKDILYFKKKDTKVKKSNVYRTTIECSMFIKKETFEKIGMYDETLGIGTKFGAEEGADLVCRLLYKKYNLQYKAKTFFYHANKRDEILYERAYSYNIGFGGFFYKHIRIYKKIYPVSLFMILKLGKNILHILIGIFTINKEKVKYNYYCIKGKIVGIQKRRKMK